MAAMYPTWENNPPGKKEEHTMKKGLIAGVLSLMIAGTACVQAFAAETVGKNGQIYQPGGYGYDRRKRHRSEI